MDLFENSLMEFSLIFMKIGPNNYKPIISSKYLLKSNFMIIMQISLSTHTLNHYLVVYINSIVCY